MDQKKCFRILLFLALFSMQVNAGGVVSVRDSSPVDDSKEWKPVEGKMMTPFGKKVTVDNVWKEYPRPQMVRPEWKNLNGLWEYAIRPVAIENITAYDGQILVPFCAESALSGVGKTVKKENNLWYRRSFQIPENWKGKQVLLHFGAVDYATTIWINGKKAGEHKGGYDSFSFNITKFLNRKGDQQIVVSVWDPTDEGYQPRGKQVNNPRGIFYTAVTGIWQTVWLEPVAETSVQSFYPVADIDREILTIHTKIANLKGDEVVRVSVKSDGKIISSAEGKAGQVLSVPMKNAHLWSPDDPFLYDMELSLSRSGKIIDEVESYCAMRKVLLGKNSNGQTSILLNNKPLFQYGTLDQGWWPDGLYTPPSEEAMAYDLKILKAMGFNMLRKHVKVEPARLYYDCDKLGLLVWQDMPSGYKSAEEKTNNRMPWDKLDWDKPKDEAALFEQELKAMVDNLRFFPSIIMWVDFNEGWGQYDTERIGEWVKNYDPSRLVNAISGWTDRNCGDIFDMHQYPSPCAEPDAKYPNRAVVLGEFGGLGWPVENHLWFSDRESGGYRTYHDASKLTNEYIQLMHHLKVARYTGIAAAVYTQTTDVEGEVNGLLTYDREICKINPQVLRIIHSDFFTDLPKLKTICNDNQLSESKMFMRTAAPKYISGEDWQMKAGMVDMKKGNEAWFKKDFRIEKKDDGYYLSVWANGDIDFIINGKQAFSKYVDAWRHYESINLSDFQDYFKEGENSIVLHVVCKGDKPFDFGVAAFNF